MVQISPFNWGHFSLFWENSFLWLSREWRDDGLIMGELIGWLREFCFHLRHGNLPKNKLDNLQNHDYFKPIPIANVTK